MSNRRTPCELDELVLTAVARAPGPVTAYQLVAELSDQLGHIAPQQVYRILERLITRGAVVRVETLNAFYPSFYESDPDRALVFCRRCRATIRARCPDLETELASVAERVGFRPGRFIVEVSGLCAACKAATSGNGAARHAG
jgi:Fur family zinc uptake transcriptional regulator